MAQQLLDDLQPLCFALAETDADREKAYRLRYQAVIERGWALQKQYPDGLERDTYDDAALHVLAWDPDQPIGTTRLVLPDPHRPLPVEESYGLTVEPRGQVVYVSRVVVARGASTLGHLVLSGLLARSWLVLRALGFLHVCGAVTPSMIRLYRRMGINVTLLGPLGPYWGEQRFPARFDMPASVEALALRRGLGRDDTT